MIPLERVRAAWHTAATYPADKEAVYPEHGAVQEFDLHREEKVLEYGCGGGSDAMSYLRRGCTVWYVDIVPTNVAAARRRIEQADLGARAYGLVIDESAKIPLIAGYFDVANAHGVLHHIDEPEPVVRELRRLLRRGGYLYAMLYTEHLWQRCLPEIRDLLATRQVGSIEEAFGWATDGRGVPYARGYTELEGRELLDGCGFEVVSARLYHTDLFRTFKAVAV